MPVHRLHLLRAAAGNDVTAVAAAPRRQRGRCLGRPSSGRPEGSRTDESQAHPRNDPDSSAAALHTNESNHTCHLPDVIFSSLLCLLHAPSLFTFLTPPEPPSKIGASMEAGSVKDLSPQRGVRSIVVRLAQIWENRNKKKELYEIGLLFLDQEGNIIEGCVAQDRIHTIQRKTKRRPGVRN